MDVVDSESFDIRYTTSEDKESILSWMNTGEMSDWFTVSSEKEKETLVNLWVAYAKHKCSLTAVFDGAPCGVATLFFFPYKKLLHLSMCYILVDPKMHRKKVGTALVKNLDHLARSYFKLERIHFEVYGQNPLIDLLKKQGYQEVFSQNKFIKLTGNKGYRKRTVMEKVF